LTVNNCLGPGSGSANYFAANYCNNLIHNGYSDWFLPSLDEMYLIYLKSSNLPMPNGSSGGYIITSSPSGYWTSNEATGLRCDWVRWAGTQIPTYCSEATHAFSIIFGGSFKGGVCCLPKSEICRVMPIRYFGYSGNFAREAVAEEYIEVPPVEDNINLYPNPANSEFNIDISNGEAGDCRIIISDILGKVVVDEFKSLSEGSNHFTYDIRDFKSGIYLVRIGKGATQRVYRLVKN
jgi:hypothetical protein